MDLGVLIKYIPGSNFEISMTQFSFILLYSKISSPSTLCILIIEPADTF